MATVAASQHGENPGPTPNPPFVFPARDSLLSSAPSSYSRSTGRLPFSSFELAGEGFAERATDLDKRRSIPATLPSFSFSPSDAVNPDTGMASPPQSPQSPQSRTIPPRHRRGTSEFIGGKSASGTGLMSTSPTKANSMLPSPTAPSFAKRGHAHRRSAALSGHDLSMILKPNNTTHSAPVSPCGYDLRTSPFDTTTRPTNKEAGESTDHNTASTPEVVPLLPSPNSLNRARVEFSETLEFIPSNRPLSLVSSDTSSTVTVRQGHSVSGSLTSIVSAGTSSPLSREQRVHNGRGVDARPKSAGPRLDGPRGSSPTPGGSPSPRRSTSNPLLKEPPATAPTSPRFPARKWAFFGHEIASGESSPSRSRPSSAASSKEPQQIVSAASTPEEDALDFPLPTIEQSASRRSSISRKPSSKKKQKKVKSWAGSILSRKPRQRSLSRRTRTPTPPLRSYQSMNEATPRLDFEQTSSSNDSLGSGPTVKLDLATDFASWRPRHIPQHEDSMSPIIDLDAALGPFNTPSGRDAKWDAVNGGSSTTKRGKRMHSAAGMGNFLGPGMHYHRRAESAPEFENPRFGLHRLGSSSTMADVFEEDEEGDEWEDAKASSDKESSCKVEDEDETGLGIDIKVVDAENMHADKAMDWTVDEEAGSLQRGLKRKGSGLSEGERRQVGSSMKSKHSNATLQDEPILEESYSPIEIVDDSIPPRPDSRAQSSDSTATPPFHARQAKELTPVFIQPFGLQAPYLTPTSPYSMTQSSFPSPRSPFSYDTQRISTAPSSIAEECGFQSLLLGEPGPELRVSVDVPSLTSSNSTMTRDSGIFAVSQNPQFRDGQRSASLSSAAVTRKRSSMASLSRLISSSHGEKSKLSIESRAPYIMEPDKKEKESKTKRISRMMQFWKPKDSAS